MLRLKSNDTRYVEEVRIRFLQKDNLLVVHERANSYKYIHVDSTYVWFCSVMNAKNISTLYIVDSMTLFL